MKLAGHLALVLLLATAAPAFADLTKGSRTLALFGGLGGSATRYDFDGTEDESVTGGGGAFGAQALVYLAGSPAIALGLDFNESPNGTLRSDELIAGEDATARMKSTVGLVVARLAFPRGTWRPYIFGGIGAHRSSLFLSSRAPGGPSRVLVDERQTSFAAGYGIGLDIFPAESLFIGTELRGAWLAGLEPEGTAAARAAGVTFDDDDEVAVTQGNVFLRVGVTF